MLKAIFIVTIMSFNLQLTENAYTEFLEYQVVERGVVTEALAASWGAKKISGRRYLVMQPKSGSQVFLRFIEGIENRSYEPASYNPPSYEPMRQEGWNAVEILVQDPDALAEQLQDSPFNVVGLPNFLTEKQNIRAFQALGPNHELLYFTQVIDPAKSTFDLGQAQSYVDRVFIMVLGGKDMAAMQSFYRDTLKLPVSGPYPYRIGVLSKAYGLPLETIHQLAIAALPNQFLLEIDQYPEAAKSITTNNGNLPSGVAMVSFQVESLTNVDLPFIAPPMPIEGGIYDGRRSATLHGALGELIELVEIPNIKQKGTETP